jgi:hypothetical protein
MSEGHIHEVFLIFLLHNAPVKKIAFVTVIIDKKTYLNKSNLETSNLHDNSVLIF